MTLDNKTVIVLYDGACPTCIKDRQHYEKLVGIKGKNIRWLDFNQHETLLARFNISPYAAMTELHLIVDDQKVIKSLDAYIILLSHITFFKPLAWLIGLNFIYQPLTQYYRYRVQKRLKRSGRIS